MPVGRRLACRRGFAGRAISGSVTSTGTQNALQGAAVTIPALRRGELTDNAGAFVFPNLPPGPHEVVISYTGFNDERRTVEVRAGGTTRLDAALKPTPAITMEAFTVSVQREGDALAVTEQRNADNIKNVAAIDSWGNMPNMSVGELAMRLPGLTFQLDDDNVVMNVSIRGMSTDFTRLSIDGLSATSVAGNGRTASLHSFSGALYEQVEIVSGVLPDSAADSIGGSLNYRKFTGRVTTNYTGTIITSFSTTAANRIYRKPITTTNVNLTYRLHRHATLFCDVSNVFETEPSFYRYVPERVREIRFLPSAVTFGVNGQF